MSLQLYFLFVIGLLMILGGIWCGYEKDTVLPVISLIYMSLTGLGYLIGLGFVILKGLL